MSFLRQNSKTTTGLAATAAGTQATSVALESGINTITTVTTAADGVKLPKANPGRVVIVANAAAANAANVFPQPTDSINALAANAAYSLTANKVAMFVATRNGVWMTIPA